MSPDVDAGVFVHREERVVNTDNNETIGADIPVPSPAGADPTSGAGPVPGPGVAPAAGVSFAPVSPRAKKRVKLIGALVGVLVVLVIAGVVAIKVVNSSRTPEAEVRRYLDLLASGQASAATAMVDPGVNNDQRTFLTDDVMASASSLLVIEDVVADKNEGSDTRTVTATMQVNGERFTHDFTVTMGKSTLGVLNNWTVKDSLAAQVSVDAEGYTQFTVGGTSADVSSAVRSGKDNAYLFYPGVYTFTPVAPSEYVNVNTKTVTVLDGVHGRFANHADAADVSLEATYSDKLKEAALESAKEFLNSCASIPGNQNSNCPSALQSDAVTAISVKTMPTTMEPMDIDPGVFQGPVTFAVTYSDKSTTPGTRDVDTTVVVNVQFSNDGLLKLTSDGKPDFWVGVSR